MKEIGYKRGVLVEKHEKGIVEIDESRMGTVNVDTNSRFTFEGESIPIPLREAGNFAGKALYLTGRFDWCLCLDDTSVICLIPLRKQKEEVEEYE